MTTRESFPPSENVLSDKPAVFAGLAYTLVVCLCIASDRLILALAPILSFFIVFLIARFKSRVWVVFFFLSNTLTLFVFRGIFWGYSINEFFLFVASLLIPFLFFSQQRARLSSLPYLNTFFFLLLALSASCLHASWNGCLSMNVLRYSIRFIIFFISFYFLLAMLSNNNFSLALQSYIVSGLLFSIMLFFMVLCLGYPYEEPGRLSIRNYFFTNWVCCYMELFFPLTFFLFWGATNTITRIAFGLLALLFLTSILLTYSKGGLITVSICFLFIFFKDFNLKSFLAGLFLALLFSIQFLQGYQHRLSFTDRDQLLSSLTRIELLKTAGRIISDGALLIGYGINSFAELKNSYGFYSFIDLKKVMSPHNLYAELMVSLGLIGFILFFSIILRILFKLARTKTVNNVALKYGLLFTIISYLVHGLVDCFLIVPAFSIAFFSVLSFSWFFSENVKTIDAGQII
ncbi:MAG: O-antigen ligase family protein [Fibrobacterota bacterium]